MRWFFIPFLLSSGLASGIGPSFSREIQPILSNKCYFCHGPDEAKREAGLRLDTFEGATAALHESTGHAIVPGDPAASELIRRVKSKDADVVMPPPDSHLVLDAAEITLLEKWIHAGALYETHWAFARLPEDVPVPASGESQEIDRFVQARLTLERLKPSPPASPERLLRRVTFDLTGLPPTPEEIAEFDPAKFGEAVDRLLSSPHYGETMALQWLDAARYADSYGYQSDQLMPQWPWRDWVIRAFNDNLPYDQFLTWQLAGDLLPDATRDQKLATAFNRLHRMTQEGGTIHEEARIEGVADRVHTMGTAFLALTMECARCHDHKYDPITARDYYSLAAFFNSIPERGVYGHQDIVPGPALLLPTPEQEEQILEASAAVSNAEVELAAMLASPGRPKPEGEPAHIPGRVADFDFHPSDEPDHSSDKVGGALAALGGVTLVDSPTGTAVRFDGDTGISIPGLLEFDWPQSWTVDVVLKDSVANPQPVILWHRSFGTDAGYNGIECLLAGGRIEVRLVRDWPGSAVGRITGPVIGKDRWHRVTITWNGSGRADGLAIYTDGVLQSSRATADRLRQSITTRSHGDGTFTLGERFRDRGFSDGEIDALSVFHRPLTPEEVSELSHPDSATAPIGEVDHAAFSPALETVRGKLAAARQRVVDLESMVHSVAIMEDTATARETWILGRGAYDAPRTSDNLVTRTTFAQTLPPFTDDHPRDRLGLARWMTHPDHPLTARVFVNRVWQHFFGTGLVATSDNFGLQGSPPSHPQLLDWLARDFVSSGWDIKRLCRRIVLSDTYRQDSKPTPRMLERDPENILLARGPAHRLGAEPIRDLALAAAGMLVPRIGGPPVYPYQPGEDLWRESNSMSPAYVQSTGENLFRRSIYSVWKRTAPLPNALLFDAAGRETCVVNRSSTNTPLQALVLLNDPQFVEPARALAELVMKAHPHDPSRQMDFAFLRLTGRRPDSAEFEVIMRALQHQHEMFRDRPEEIHAYLATGTIPPDPTLDPLELAAVTVICQTILNLDAAIWKR